MIDLVMKKNKSSIYELNISNKTYLISVKDINYIRTDDSYPSNSNSYIYIYFANKEDNPLRIIFDSRDDEKSLFALHSAKLKELFKYYNEKK
jgi:putative heme iron utilization protein